jgi:P27 family predicted phage terminase small subunit
MTKGRKGRDPLTDSQRRALGRPAKSSGISGKVPGLSIESALPDPPEFLDEDGREEWARIGRFLLFTRRVSQLDKQALALYCNSWSLFGQAMRPLLIRRQQLWGLVNDRPRPAKLEEVARRHASIVIEQARRFGMTARTRHLDHADTGRPALPNELHELRGNPSKKKLDKGTLEASGWQVDDIREPYWFDRTASAEWHRLFETYTNINIFTPMDVAVLAIGCGSWALYSLASEQLKSQSLVEPLDDGSGVEHPLSTIMRHQREIMKAVWIDYGMTPLDRRRFKHAGGGGESQERRFKIYLGD